MRHRTLRTVLVAGGATLTLLALGAGPAAAHVGTSVDEVAADSTTALGLTIGHGCDDSDTTAVAVQIPEGVNQAQAFAKPGWTVEARVGGPARTRRGGPRRGDHRADRHHHVHGRARERAAARPAGHVHDQLHRAGRGGRDALLQDDPDVRGRRDPLDRRVRWRRRGAGEPCTGGDGDRRRGRAVAMTRRRPPTRGRGPRRRGLGHDEAKATTRPPMQRRRPPSPTATTAARTASPSPCWWSAPSA